MLAYAFVLILGPNPGAVPRMGLHPSHLSLLGLAFFIYVIYLCGVPNKSVKKKKGR